MAEEMVVTTNGVSRTDNYTQKKKKLGYVHLGVIAAPATTTLVANVNLTNTTLTKVANTLPDVPRNVQVKVVDTTPSITKGRVTVNGKDINGNTIAEIFDFTGAGTKQGAKIFSLITSVVTSGFATLGGDGDEKIECGFGNIYGLPLGTNQELSSVPVGIQNKSNPGAVTSINAAMKGYTPHTTPNGSISYEAIFEYFDK